MQGVIPPFPIHSHDIHTGDIVFTCNQLEFVLFIIMDVQLLCLILCTFAFFKHFLSSCKYTSRLTTYLLNHHTCLIVESWLSVDNSNGDILTSYVTEFVDTGTKFYFRHL